MRISTSRFGVLEIADTAIIHFPRGLYGMESLRRYCLLPHTEGVFFWLQSLDTPELALVVTDPFRLVPQYEVTIPDASAKVIRAFEAKDLAIYTTVTVARDKKSVSTNLMGPLVINQHSRLGVQIILDGTRFEASHPIGNHQDGVAASPLRPIVAEAHPLNSLNASLSPAIQAGL